MHLLTLDNHQLVVQGIREEQPPGVTALLWFAALAPDSVAPDVAFVHAVRGSMYTQNLCLLYCNINRRPWCAAHVAGVDDMLQGTFLHPKPVGRLLPCRLTVPLCCANPL